MSESKSGDDVLTRYINARLEQIAPAFAEPEVVADQLRLNREIWQKLYEIELEYDPEFNLADPS